MEGELGDEDSRIEERVGLLGKENHYLLKPRVAGSIQQSHDGVISVTDGQSGHDMFEDVNRALCQGDASEFTYGTYQCMDDAVNMVEELMIRDCDSQSGFIGTSKHRERIHVKQLQRYRPYQLGGSGTSHDTNMYGDNGLATCGWGYPRIDEPTSQMASTSDHMETVGLASMNGSVEDSVRTVTHQGMSSKLISKSGFYDFFIKKSMKGKTTVCRGTRPDGLKADVRDQCSGEIFGAEYRPSVENSCDGKSLRGWINLNRQTSSKIDILSIFRQVVDLVDSFHSQGIVLRDLRPSCFKLHNLNKVKYIGTLIRVDTQGVATEDDPVHTETPSTKRSQVLQDMYHSGATIGKRHKFGENMEICRKWPNNNLNSKTCNFGNGFVSHVDDRSIEEMWYLSPEELAGALSTMSSNIYNMGVLLFELLGRFDSKEARATAMSELRCRILPPLFLSEYAKEAGFCLWLLHPEPSLRPTTREILHFEGIWMSKEVDAEELSSSSEQEDAESELLMQFLRCVRESKEKRAAELVEDIRRLENDFEEAFNRSYIKDLLNYPDTKNVFATSDEKSCHNTVLSLDMITRLSSMSTMSEEGRFLKNIHQLESEYFSMRSKIKHPDSIGYARRDKDLLRTREVKQQSRNGVSNDFLGSFSDGLCKYARYSRFEVRGMVRTGEFNNPANVICSLSFDRDSEYFAAAGISKKIKIFEFDALLNNPFDVSYPVMEIPNKSKLSCISWNSYIKNYLASTGYDGIVKIWDVSTGQGVFQFNEHEKRAWSVDFSPAYPTKLASGSDDCSLKLWNINEKSSLGTIRNMASICSVQFSHHSMHMLSFGSADYKTYCYDLRNFRMPWCVLAGHKKAVSYVKFLDSETIVTASTDNSLKIWDLNKTSHTSESDAACILTLRGHKNEKNFVGLSVSNGYITCGSETNEVFAYYRSLPMPIASHKLGSVDPLSDKDSDDANNFVSSVCWRGETDMLVAANRTGCIQLLQMI